MKSHEALRQAIAGKTVEHAKRLGLSTGLLHKWQEPSTDWSDSGAYNPLDRIEALMQEAERLGQRPDQAHAPLLWLAAQFRYVCIRIGSDDPADLSQELLKTAREFGELAAATSEALLDGRISFVEADTIEREGWHLIRQTAAFMARVREAVK